MKIQNTLLFLAVTSVIVPTLVMSSALMPMNRYTGVSDEMRTNADSIDKARLAHVKIAQAYQKAKDFEQTPEFKDLQGPTKTAVRNARIQLDKTEKVHKKYLDDAQRLSAQMTKTTKIFKKNSKAESEELHRLSAKKDEALASDQSVKPSDFMNVAKKKSITGRNPATWAPRITVDPRTDITYIQTYDKNGKLGAKKVYRNHKETVAAGISPDTIFEDFEKDVEVDVKDIEHTF